MPFVFVQATGAGTRIMTDSLAGSLSGIKKARPEAEGKSIEHFCMILCLPSTRNFAVGTLCCALRCVRVTLTVLSGGTWIGDQRFAPCANLQLSHRNPSDK